MSTVPNADDLKALAVKLAAVTDRVAARLQQTSEQSLSASQAMARHVDDARKVAEDMTRDALDQFRQTASGAIREGLRDATGRHDQALAASAQKVADAVSQLEARIVGSGKAQWATAWKAFLALVLASVAVVAVAVYMVWQSQQALAALKWQQELAEAQAAGKLAPCPEGGLCALINKRWTRIDR